MTTSPSLTRYAPLGRSGLRVSPLTLGAGTFGQAWGSGWSTDEATARKITNRFLDSGANVIDTADGYQGGQSEQWVGKFVKERGNRDQVVIATKFSFGRRPGDPNSGGNTRKNILAACDASLERLGMDYIDLYWLHAWDGFTSAEEVMGTLDRLVQSGKVRYVGFSNVPAWFLGRAQTIAELRGWEKLCALQLEYSLVTREIEREFIPAAQEMGLGICPWSPLANGLLSGKYRKGADGKVAGDGRLGLGGFATGVNSDLRDRNVRIVDEVVAVAKELERSPAQVAINWVTNRPGVTSTILGVTKLEQLDANLTALDFAIPAPLRARLDAVSEQPVGYPYNFFTGDIHKSVSATTTIARR